MPDFKLRSEYTPQGDQPSAIEELVELNRDHPYTYDRDALVGMLDEALAD